MISFRTTLLLCSALALVPAGRAFAQTDTAAPQNSASAAAQAFDDDPDMDLNRSEPDFTLITLPTNLRMPKYKSGFRVTHRFGRPLGQGDIGDLVDDLFGLDSGAQIGLEYRFGLARGLQVGLHRTSNRTIEFFTAYNILQQRDHPIALSATATIEGVDNFRDSYSPSLGLVISRELGNHGAIYVEPIWVNNTNPLPGELSDDNDTFMVGLGARLRVRPTVYLVGEVMPRTGYAPNNTFATFGLEKRSGGHSFQLNFSNGYGTTMAQVARGSVTANDDWYLGFQITRKFF